jgi:hypothetical protein
MCLQVLNAPPAAGWPVHKASWAVASPSGCCAWWQLLNSANESEFWMRCPGPLVVLGVHVLEPAAPQETLVAEGWLSAGRARAHRPCMLMIPSTSLSKHSNERDRLHIATLGAQASV